MKKNKSMLVVYIILYNFIFTQECPPLDTLVISPMQNLWDLPNKNVWDNVEIMTWNLKSFPISDENTISNVNEIITDILPDMIAFQEINDIGAYNLLLESLSAYDFINSGNGLAFAARKDIVEINGHTTLFGSYGYDFAYRYPLQIEIDWICGLGSIPLKIIVLHLKAGGEQEDFDRRYAACDHLSEYVNSNLNDNIILLGDYNDEINDVENNNSLWPLISNGSVSFVTESIANNNYYATFPSWPSFIDHIAISQTLFDENLISEITTIRIDDYTGYAYFENNISDHRPVIWSFPLDEILVPEGLVINEIMNNPLNVSDTYGEWIELTNIGNVNINLNGLIISDNDGEYHAINEVEGLFLSPNEFIVLGINDDLELNGGISLDYIYTDFFLSNSWDEVIISHPSGIILDEVYYDNGITFPDLSGSSMELISPYFDNSDGTNWMSCLDSLPYGDFGSPGEANFSECSLSGSGEVNGDQIINILDLVLIVQFILNEIVFLDWQICESDINFDGQIDILDIVLIVFNILEAYRF